MTKLSRHEKKAIARISEELTGPYNICSDDVGISMRRGVEMYQAGFPTKADIIDVTIRADDPEILEHSSQIQGRLANVLGDVWKKNRPLVDVHVLGKLPENDLAL